NLGSSGYKLPAGFVFQLIDARGLSFAATAVAGNETLLPQQTGKLTLQANVSRSFTDDQFTIQMLNKTQTDSTLVGSLANHESDPGKIGQLLNWPSVHSEGDTITIDRDSFKAGTDGITAEAQIHIINNGKSIVSLPAVSASYQVNANEISVASPNAVSQATLLPPNESITRTFQATLPTGVDIRDT